MHYHKSNWYFYYIDFLLIIDLLLRLLYNFYKTEIVEASKSRWKTCHLW